MFNRSTRGAMTRGLLALSVICLGATDASASDVVGIYAGRTGDAILKSFDRETGQGQGTGDPLAAGQFLDFAKVGAAAFAPDGTFWAVYSAGAGDAYFGQFDPATGARESAGGYLNNGANLTFANVGAMAFAPDGGLWGVYQVNGNAFFGQFDPLTGARDGGGAYLSNGSTIAFDNVGAVAFAPDGTLWAVYQVNGDAFFGQFDPMTGARDGSGGYLTAGQRLSFAKVGAMAFDTDGTLWGVYSAGAEDAFFGQFDPQTGLRDGGGGYLSTGSHVAFANVGAMTFRAQGAVPEPATWLMMMIGLGAAGCALRKRNSNSAEACVSR